MQGKPKRYSVHVNGPWCITFARNLGVSRQTVHAVLAERSGVSAEMALRLGTLLGNGAQLWLDMQTQFDLWCAEIKLHDELGQMKPREPMELA